MRLIRGSRSVGGRHRGPGPGPWVVEGREDGGEGKKTEKTESVRPEELR